MEQDAKEEQLGWLASAIRETRLFWREVYDVNHLAGYIMLFACFFLIGYALYVWGQRGKQKDLDKRVEKKRRNRRRK